MPSLPRVRRFSDPRAFLARAGPWLMRREVEHTLPLGIARDLASGQEADGSAGEPDATSGPAASDPGQPDPGPPFYLATAEAEGRILGCILRTPPRPLVVTDLPPEAHVPVARDVADAFGTLPGVIGPRAAAAAFARAWSESEGTSAEPSVHERLFRLERLILPERRASGEHRRAGRDDRERVMDWVRAFVEETHIGGPDPAGTAVRLLERGEVVLWDARGAPRSMAAIGARSPHVARIGFVYTPPAERGQGYASACVASLTQDLLGHGCESVVLFTDLANPTSNAIYARLGYRPVEDVTEWSFGPGAEPG